MPETKANLRDCISDEKCLLVKPGGFAHVWLTIAVKWTIAVCFKGVACHGWFFSVVC